LPEPKEEALLTPDLKFMADSPMPETSVPTEQSFAEILSMPDENILSKRDPIWWDWMLPS